ncbi:hypothetical protein [Rikenella microfusus]|uniref:hypothetical protein n=1 Tax=Rikenella microfusus TaxID=28139 RepID=UPI00235750DC|nr:hypothetical protein [Rikenella microfusus]
MKTNQPVLAELIARLEQIRNDFFNCIPDDDSAAGDQALFENAITDAQDAIGTFITKGIIADATSKAREE